MFAGCLCGVLSCPYGIFNRQDCSVDDAPPKWIHSPNGDAKVGHTMYVSRSNQLVTCPWKAGKSLDQVLYEFVGHGGMGGGLCFLHLLILIQLPVSYGARTQSCSCIRFPSCPALHAGTPRPCRELEYAYRSTKDQVCGKRVEQNRTPRMKSCSTANGESQMEMRQCSDGKRRCATKTLARLYIVNATCAVRSCINHPSQRCPEKKGIELQTFYSVNIGDVTNELHHLDNQDVVSECENQLFYKDFAEKRSVERCATRLAFCESIRV